MSGLFVYPFKAAAGIAVETVAVDSVGLRWDRCWMAVDAHGRFMSQRTHPRLALLRPHLVDQELAVDTDGMRTLLLPRAEPDPEGYEETRVWFSDRYSVDCGDAAAAWISDFLGQPSRIVRAVRPPDHPLVTGEGRVCGGFADASPALVVSHASLAALNRRLSERLPMSRFRPNLVVDGFGAFGEDDWGRARIGGVPTHGLRPCPRCAATLVDQATGEKGVEPLHTLATFRRNASGDVDFGMNIVFEAPGVLRVGDRIVS